MKPDGREDDDQDGENDFSSMAKIILEGLGGKDNLTRSGNWQDIDIGGQKSDICSMRTAL